MEGGNWSEEVEDLVSAGEIEKAISLLQSVVSKLETLDSSGSDLRLASALAELAALYSSQGFSLKSDEISSHVSVIKQRAHSVLPPSSDKVVAVRAMEAVRVSDDGHPEKPIKLSNAVLPCDDSLDDDWESIADRAPEELLSSECLSKVSELSLKDTQVPVKVQAPKRRGRGTFSYKKDELFSDQQNDKSRIEDAEDKDPGQHSIENTETKHSRYGTRHVLVLADFPPSTRTTELEKLFEDFRDCIVVIRWVNDTTALAVFQTPSIALDARNSIRFPFTVRILDEDDILMSSVTTKDLEPPRQRPKTSARTAQRLIAHGMGLKLPTAGFGSKEYRKQEEERRNRIVSRQKLRDDAWGSDDTN